MDVIEPEVQSLIETVPVGLYRCDAPSGAITFYNSRAAKLWGRAPTVGERFCGSQRLLRPDGTLLRHEDSPMAFAVRAGRRARNEELVVERPDGSFITVFSNVDPIFDETGRLIGAIDAFHDATTLKQAELARARLAAIVESSDDAIISKDLNGVITSWNRAAERLFGYTASEAVGQSITMLIPAERHDEEPGILERVRRGHRIDHYETVRRRKSGALLDISLTVSPVFDELGNVVGASKIARDITENKRIAALVERDRQAVNWLYECGKRCLRPGDHFRENLTEMLDAAIWITRAEKGSLHLCNETSRAPKIEAQRGLEASARDWLADARAEQACRGAWMRGERIVVEDVSRSDSFSDRTTLSILHSAGIRALQATPLISSTGSLLGVISTYFPALCRPSERDLALLDVLARQAGDYVERKRAEEQREQLLRMAEKSREEAELANRAKDEFLAMLGHELRNPLSAVHNSIAIATLDESRGHRALDIARRGVDQLNRLVDDLLDVARITQGRVPLRRTRVSLSEVLRRTVDCARVLMDSREHSLKLTVPADDVFVDGDAARLEQAISNLLSNAAKYTDPGGTIDVTLEREGSRAVVRVSDSGVGIAPDVLPRVFDLFVQAERSLDRAQGGLGIGLTLVRRIVELHGGTVEAHSAGLGRGAQFVVRLEAQPASDREAPSAEQPDAHQQRHHARVLLVEDNLDVSESLTEILEILGHEVRAAPNGFAALEALRASEPDIVFIDIGLPKMDGYELARRIRAEPTHEGLVLVALTGYGRSEDKARSKAAGFDHHLTKPVDLGVIEDLVGRLGSDGGHETSTARQN